MKAFTPRGLPRNRQTIAFNQVPPVNPGTPSVSAGLRQIPDWGGTRLRRIPDWGGGKLRRIPDYGGGKLRRIPNYGGGRLPDGTDLRQCPSTEGHLLECPVSEGN